MAFHRAFDASAGQGMFQRIELAILSEARKSTTGSELRGARADVETWLPGSTSGKALR